MDDPDAALSEALGHPPGVLISGDLRPIDDDRVDLPDRRSACDYVDLLFPVVLRLGQVRTDMAGVRPDLPLHGLAVLLVRLQDQRTGSALLGRVEGLQ